MKKRTENSDSVKLLVGERLKSARDALDITRECLCDILSEQEPDMKQLHPDTLKQWELGRNQINIAWIPAICKVLNCDVGYLFGEHKEKTYLTCDICEKTGLEENAIAKLTHLKRLDSYYSHTMASLLSSMITDDSLFPEIYRSFVTIWNITNLKSTVSDDMEPIVSKGGGVYLFGDDAVDTIMFSIQKRIVDFMRDFFDIAEGRINNATKK